VRCNAREVDASVLKQCFCEEGQRVQGGEEGGGEGSGYTDTVGGSLWRLGEGKI